MEKEVEVLSVQRFIDLSDGKTIYQITMAKPHKITEEIKKRLSNEQIASSEIYSNMIQFTVPIENGHMYPVGSTWEVEINKDGSLSIKPTKKK
jgi:hypothetical protein